MTVENTIRKYKHFVDKGWTEPAKELMQHMKSSKKYTNHPLFTELLGLKNVKKPTR